MIATVLYAVILLEAIVLHICFVLLPRFSEPGLFFTILVPEAFHTSEEGDRIQANYRAVIGRGTALGVLAGWLVLLVLQLKHAAIAPRFFALLATSFFQHAAMYYGMQKARQDVRNCMSTMGSENAPSGAEPRRQAMLTPRRPPFSIHWWVGPFAMLAVAAVLFRSSGMFWGANAGLLFGTALLEMLLFMLCLEASRMRRLHNTGEKSKEEAIRYESMQWAMLLGSYLSSWQIWVQWAVQMDMISAAIALFLTMAPFTLLMAFIWVRFMWTFCRQLNQTRPEVDSSGDKTPNEAWFLGLFYFNRADPAVFVRERWGIGWTANLGNPIVQGGLLSVGLIHVTVFVLTRILAIP